MAVRRGPQGSERRAQDTGSENGSDRCKKRFQCEWVHNGREVWKTPPGYALQPRLLQLRCLLGGTPEESLWLATESWKGDGVYGSHGDHKGNLSLNARTNGGCMCYVTSVAEQGRALRSAPVAPKEKRQQDSVRRQPLKPAETSRKTQAQCAIPLTLAQTQRATQEKRKRRGGNTPKSPCPWFSTSSACFAYKRAINLRCVASPCEAERSNMAANIVVAPALTNRSSQQTPSSFLDTVQPNPTHATVQEASAYMDVFHPKYPFSFSSSNAWIRMLHFPAGKVVGLCIGLDPFPGGGGQTPTWTYPFRFGRTLCGAG